MATKGSTSGQSIENIRKREQERRDARHNARKRSAAEERKRQVRVTGYRTLVLVIKDRSKENLQLCYNRTDLLITYFPKFKYHEHKQRAVMQGRLVLPDLPGELYVDLLSLMTAGQAGWQQGSMGEVQNG